MNAIYTVINFINYEIQEAYIMNSTAKILQQKATTESNMQIIDNKYIQYYKKVYILLTEEARIIKLVHKAVAHRH